MSNSLIGYYKSYEEIPKELISHYPQKTPKRAGQHGAAFQEPKDFVAYIKTKEVEEEHYRVNALRTKMLGQELGRNIDPTQKTKVVEYGGAWGGSWVTWKDKFQLDYNIIEIPSMVEWAKKRLGQDGTRDITFYDKPVSLKNVGAVYIRAALQYDQDWKTTLLTLLKNKPKKIILEHLASGDVETFYTIQNWDTSKMPWCFINFNELNNLLEGLGYNLTYSVDEKYNFSRLFKDVNPEHHLKFVKNVVYEQ